MNTLGLGRAVNTLQLGKPAGVIVQAWREIVKFTLAIKRNVAFNLKR